MAAGVAVGALGGAHERKPDLAHHDLGVAALGGDTRGRAAPALSEAGTVRAKNESRRSGPGGGKICVSGRANSAWIWSCARRTVAVEATILGRTARPSISRTHSPSIAASYRPAIVPSGPEIRCKLVLDDEVGRRQRRCEARSPARLGGAVEARRVMPVRAAEQRSRLPDPRERRELVDRGDQERRQPPVERLIDGDDRQRPIAREVALEVRADDAQLVRLIVVGQQRERLRLEARPAPRAVLERDRRGLALRDRP